MTDGRGPQRFLINKKEDKELKSNRMSKDVENYEELRQKIFAALKAHEDHWLGEYIPPAAAMYWLIGQVLVWHSEELLEAFAQDIREQFQKDWSSKDLLKMAQLYLRYPTVEQFAGRCAGRSTDMTLCQLLDREAL